MHKFKILVLTDHTTHSRENSIYALLRAMAQHPDCALVQVGSRGNHQNDAFFYTCTTTDLQVTTIDGTFDFQESGQQFTENCISKNLQNYDAIFMRLPRPISQQFFAFLSNSFPPKYIINRPSGMMEVGSKKFLLQVKHLCPPIRWCNSLDDIEKFSEHFPIVLKPLENYGGKGIVKVENGTVSVQKKTMSLEDYLPFLQKEFDNGGYLAMKFLKNVKEGDKRILVVNGKILGASLRLPPPDSWICNVSQGGQSIFAKPTEDEIHMTNILSPTLREKGVLIYGFDTLVNDDGKRVLSEINALSIGGFPQAEQQSGKPVVQQTINLFFQYLQTIASADTTANNTNT